MAKPPKTTERQTTAADGLPVLHKRSERLANHPLANIASSKRAEVILMRRLSVLPDNATAANSESKQAYDQLYKQRMDNDHYEAVRDLVPALRCNGPALGLLA